MAPTVNKPTDVMQKEADVNRKLQIYGIISAFKTGKVPSVRPFLDSLSQYQVLTHLIERSDRCGFK